MDIWKFINLDKEVLRLFSILFVLSIILSIFIPGSPGYLCYRLQCSSVGSGDFGLYFFRYSGIGLPFGWANLSFEYRSTCTEKSPNVVTCPANTVAPTVIMFDPINFVLDVIILYIIALLIVRTYGRYFRKKKRK